MNPPKISVVMSAYNAEKYIAKAIGSILNQTFRDFEFIIINDGSKDNTLNIIKKCQKEDKRIKIINNKGNIGLTKSLNKGLKIAKGKYIARMDADDISMPERFQIQYDFLEKNPKIFLVGSSCFIMYEGGIRIGSQICLVDPTGIKKKLEKKCCMIHPSIMFKSDNQTFYREKFLYAQDYDLYLRIISNNKRIHIIQEPLVKYRTNSKSISITKNKQQKLFGKKAIEFFKERKEKGEDSYDVWDNKEILNIRDSNSEILFLQKCIENELREKNKEKMYIHLNKYKSLEKCSKFRYLFYLLFYKFPSIYKIYRKLFYGDNLK